MSKSIESTLSSIDERIKKLQEQKKNEIRKLEQRVGRKFITTFELSDIPLGEIEKFIDDLKEKQD